MLCATLCGYVYAHFSAPGSPVGEPRTSKLNGPSFFFRSVVKVPSFLSTLSQSRWSGCYGAFSKNGLIPMFLQLNRTAGTNQCWRTFTRHVTAVLRLCSIYVLYPNKSEHTIPFSVYPSVPLLTSKQAYPPVMGPGEMGAASERWS